MQNQELTTWLAETCDQSQRYAEVGMLRILVALTSDPHKARRFATRDECLAFCTDPYMQVALPPVRPVEHVFHGSA